MNQALPSNVDAERSVIGTLLLAPDRLSSVSGILTPSDYYHPGWGAVYDALCSLAADGLPVDALTIADRMKRDETAHMLNSLGGIDALVSVQAEVIGIEGVQHHARIIARKAKARRIIQAASNLARAGLSALDIDEYLAEVRKWALSVLVEDKGEQCPRPAAHFMRQVFRELEQRQERAKSGSSAGIPTAFERIDSLLGGLFVGEVMIVGARPGMGKTSMLMGTLINAARAGVPSLVFSKEMRGALLWERAVASEGRIPLTRLRRGALEQEHWTQLHKIAGELAALPVHVDEDGDASIEDIHARAQQWRAQQKDPGAPAIIGVDYVQLVKGRSKVRSRDEEVSEVSRGLKLIAKDLKVAVIALASLNREVEKREDKRPKVSDLRDSGAIESDADVVALMYREGAYTRRRASDHGDPEVCEFIVGKNRNGPTGTVKLRWQGEFTRFENLPRPDYDEEGADA